jgi:uncharacterized protein involved in exopolysaccharide biosynthesis
MNNNHTISETEIDIKDLFLIIWKHKLVVITITLICAISSVIYAISLPNIYSSSAKLSPASSSNQNNSIGSSFAQYTSLASIAGVSLPSGTSGGSKLAIETMKSYSFLDHLVSNFSFIAPGLMASQDYDELSKTIIYNSSVYNELDNTWVRDAPIGRKKEPSYIEIYDAYMSTISIEENITTGFITLTVKHISPQFSYQLASVIIQEINNVTKKKDVEDSRKAIKFLEKRLSQTNEAELRIKIGALIYSHLNTLMMADIKENYILELIDPPYLAEERTSPSRSTICIIGTILGALFASLLVILYHYNFAKPSKNN